MITSWRLFNFKSFREDTTVALGPLTVLAGANSSGKSTLLQSMLMMEQTLDSRVASRPIVLNGPLVRLGPFGDVRSYESESESVQVAFTAQPQTLPSTSVSCSVSFDGEGESAEIAQLHPSLRSSEITMRMLDGGVEATSSMKVQRAAMSIAERAQALGLNEDRDGDLQFLSYEGELHSEFVGAARDDFAGVQLRHFLPVHGLRRMLPDKLEVVPMPASIMSGATIVDTALAAIRYLGPLRDAPRALYPLSTTADTTDVGLRGEHTAAVFDLHRNTLVRYVPTSCFAPPAPNAPAVASDVRLRSLETAVVEWLRYLGVVESLTTRDLGNLGHQLKVTTAGVKRPHDMTHVGTGVSQILPIVVMCLLATPDTTLLIEQPELHMHPRVQTLLGDFFLASAMAGRQVIVETHSEYLVNRLRYRIAASEGDRVAQLVKTYFVEKDARGGSVFRTVGVNRYGAIREWPKGFFDQSQREIEQILLAGSMKKKAERDGGRDGKSGA